MKSIPVLAKATFVIIYFIILSSFKCSNNNSAPSTIPPVNTVSVSSILTEQQFNALFPQRDKFYTYAAFIKAVNQLGAIKVTVARRAASVYKLTRTDKRTGKSTIVRQDGDWNEDWAKKKPDSVYMIDYGNFCSEKSPEINKKELAAFFANIAHETRHGENGTYTDGLMFVHENDTTLPYVADNDSYPAAAGKRYYGRGPLQISYNGNYGYASDCIFGDKKILLDNPDMVETDPVTAFKTAVYFWMTPQTLKPSAHDVMTGKWQPAATDKAKGRVPGFGMTINIINGGIECNHGENMYSMNDRIAFYRHFLKKLGVTDPDCACSCGKMASY